MTASTYYHDYNLLVLVGEDECWPILQLIVGAHFTHESFLWCFFCFRFWCARYCKELRNRAEEVVTQALHLYNTKGLKKAVQFLIASNFISDTPR